MTYHVGLGVVYLLYCIVKLWLLTFATILLWSANLLCLRVCGIVSLYLLASDCRFRVVGFRAEVRRVILLMAFVCLGYLNAWNMVQYSGTSLPQGVEGVAVAVYMRDGEPLHGTFLYTINYKTSLFL